jgi:membrane-associated phospholipid phosphatase
MLSTGAGLPPPGQLATSTLTLGAGLALFLTGSLPPPGEPVPGPHWRGGILLDDAARGALRIGSAEGRELAASMSDLLLTLTIVNAMVVDAFMVPLVHDDPQLAIDASLAFSLALGITLVLGDVVKTSVRRARPYESECQGDPSADGCGTEDAYLSFYSLHAATAFTSAGFSCAMHLERSLYGDGVADALSCAASLAAASTVGVLRIAADRHYLSDVIVGSLLGFAVGYLVPVLMVPPRRERLTDAPAPDTATLPLILPMVGLGPDGTLETGTFGITVSGTF